MVPYWWNKIWRRVGKMWANVWTILKRSWNGVTIRWKIWKANRINSAKTFRNCKRSCSSSTKWLWVLPEWKHKLRLNRCLWRVHHTLGWWCFPDAYYDLNTLKGIKTQLFYWERVCLFFFSTGRMHWWVNLSTHPGSWFDRFHTPLLSRGSTTRKSILREIRENFNHKMCRIRLSNALGAFLLQMAQFSLRPLHSHFDIFHTSSLSLRQSTFHTALLFTFTLLWLQTKLSNTIQRVRHKLKYDVLSVVRKSHLCDSFRLRSVLVYWLISSEYVSTKEEIKTNWNLHAMEVNPLSVILVKSDSKGDRLLFRYPYRVDTVNDTSRQSKRRNPYSIIVQEDVLQSPPPQTSNIYQGNFQFKTGTAGSHLWYICCLYSQVSCLAFRTKYCRRCLRSRLNCAIKSLS